MFIISVAIATPLRTTFDYLSECKLKIGVRVRVLFNGRICVGIVLNNPKNSEYLDKLKHIEEVLDTTPLMDKKILEFLSLGTKYYHYPIGVAVLSALPKNLRLGKEKKIKTPLKIAKQSDDAPTPSKAQNIAIERVLSAKDYQTLLLHGITGSGKTEVYIRISEALLAQQKQVLILVPEIGLTPQMVARFSSRLKTPVAIIHSQRNDSQKTDAYLLAQNHQVGVVLGTRSAIFTPMANLGIIIIDEEHDHSFKQQSDWRYSARNLAFMRAKQLAIPLVLGSATPSLETLYNVVKKKIHYLTLTNRAGQSSLPSVRLIDMNAQENQVFSGILLRKMSRHLKEGKQVMLFINRRGYAPMFHCQYCHWQAKCEACNTNMVLHRGNYRLKCHHCGAESMPQTACPLCKKQQLMATGYGTERLEEMLYAHFPSTDVIRIDKDTTTKKKSMTLFLKKIASNKPCIIIGTQMLAKGHDFQNLSMVGILDADSSFFSIDFRSTEHLAQLLMQVAGRAGRGAEKGEVYIQTKQPNHPIFAFIKKHHYIAYAKTLLLERKNAELPPFGFQALICANAKQKQNAMDFLLNVKTLLLKFNIKSVEIWGPVEAIIEKKAHYYYVNLYLSTQNRVALHQMLSQLYLNLSQLKGRSKVRWFLDIDPL